jgi:hypothetical protein
LKLTGGCNIYSAEYKAYQNEALTSYQNGALSIFRIIPLTKVFCVVSYDSEYLNALSNSVSFEISPPVADARLPT